MKVCSKCGFEKTESEFAKDCSNKDGLRGMCKECRRKYEAEYRSKNRDKLLEYAREYRENNPDKLKIYRESAYNKNKDMNLEKNREYQKQRREKNKQKLYLYKTPCVKCGESRSYVIDFHHINPDEKLFNISTAGSRHTDVDISNEVKKCICLCRNCHQEYHYFYGNKPSDPVGTLTEYLGRNPYEV